MTIYESAKHVMKRDKGVYSEVTGSFVGIVSKMAASFLLYPFNLLRSKQQQYSSKVNVDKNVLDHSIKSRYENGNFIYTSIDIYRKIGIKGFYQGLSPLLIRQIPSSALFFYTYESTLNILKKY